MKVSTHFSIAVLTFLSLTLISLIKSNPEDLNDINICGGFIEIDTAENSHLKNEIDLSKITVNAYSIDMILKEQTSVAQSGYYFVPIYEKESIILKIEGPDGMRFEPDQYVFNVNDDVRIEDICKEDNNFKFTGYEINGQVSTFGTIEGPEQVAISLFKINKDKTHTKLQDTMTFEKGVFNFNPVYPGKYLLKPTNQIDEEKFDPKHKELIFNVSVNKPTYLEKALIVKGYKVTGHIYSNEEEPAIGVMALIYSYDSTLTAAYNCDFSESKFNKKIANELVYQNMTPFCASETDVNGKFVFNNIPYGQFLIRPYFKSEFLTYDILPAEANVDVAHKDQEIKTEFVVKSFSISGKVINHNKKGISNVNIKIDGINKATTDKDGHYTLSNLVTGYYDLEAQTDNMYFDPIQNLRITSTSQYLPEFIVKEYKLCGKINIEANESFSSIKRAVLLKEKETNVERRTVTDINGKYCFEVKPSSYHIQPLLSQEEKDAELHLTPESIDVEILDEPRLDIYFYQSKVEISGSIKCLTACQPDMKVFLKKGEKITSVNIEKLGSDTEYSFKFVNILSGQYKLSIQKFEWCWDQEEVDISVKNTNLTELKFNQVGYSLFFATQYNINVNWEKNDEPTIKGNNTFKKNESKICLPKQGLYKIFPKSCHKFEKEYFLYDTEKKERLQLVPTEFLVNGSIPINSKVLKELSTEEINQLKIKISVDEILPNSLEVYKKIENIQFKENNILFHFYTKSKTNLLITPEIVNNTTSSKSLKDKLPKLLFFPKFKQIRVEESCSENHDNLKFELRTGLIIKGTVDPPMDGVKITAYVKDTQDVITSTESLKNGTYQIGPLYTEMEYDIKATKDGYKIWATTENEYAFKAEKLSFLRVKIVDTEGNPLSSVFLSLSSANRSFKVNSNTNADGYFDFLELYSGEYYIKPLFKEYKFEPSQKMIKIEGGEHIKEEIVAHRVAFSIFGKSK